MGWKETYYSSDLNHFNYGIKFPPLKMLKPQSSYFDPAAIKTEL